MSTNLYALAEKPKAEETVTMGVRMPKSQREAWKAHCEKHNLDMSEVIRRFIASELSKVTS